MIYRIETHKKRMQAPLSLKRFTAAGIAEPDKGYDSNEAVQVMHADTYAATMPLMSLNLDMINQGRDCFRQYYRDPNYSSAFLADLVISWPVFYDAVTDANNRLQAPISLNRLALKFIHRYNTSNGRWFLTVQLCEIVGSPLDNDDAERRYECFELDSQASYFNILDNGTIGAESGSGLSTINGFEYGTDYFDNIFFGAGKVVAGRHVQSVVVAMAELHKMYNDNVIQGRNDDCKFSLVFASASSETELPSKDTYINYPHCMIIHIRYDGVNCLDDNNIIIGNFYNRAADYNTLCPRRCGLYLCPIELLGAIG